MIRQISSVVGVLSLFGVLATGCGSTTPAPANQSTANTGGTTSADSSSTPITVTVGTTPLVSSSPLFLAEGLGYWKKLGLDVQLKTYEAAGAIDVATAAGSLDVGATGITASLFNLWNSGKKEYLVADKGRIWPGQHFEALVVSNKAWDAGLHTVKDLKGKRVGDTSKGSTFDYLVGTVLEQNGMSLKDIQDIPLTSVKNIENAIESGQVDAAVMPQPGANALLKSGKAHLLLWFDDTVKTDLLAIAFSPKFHDNKDAAVKFLEGYMQAVQFYDQHVFNNKNPDDPDFKQGISIIAQYTKASPDVIPSELIYVDPNAQLDTDSIQQQFEFYKKNGFVQGDINVKDMVDTSLLQEAQSKIGK